MDAMQSSFLLRIYNTLRQANCRQWEFYVQQMFVNGQFSLSSITSAKRFRNIEQAPSPRLHNTSMSTYHTVWTDITASQQQHRDRLTAHNSVSSQHHGDASLNSTGTSSARALRMNRQKCSRPRHQVIHQALCYSSASLSMEGQQGTPAIKDAIHIRGARFYGYHGVLPAENQVGQPFVVDASLYCDLRKAGRTDDLTHTVSYAEVFNTIKAVMEGKPHQLLESLAHRIAHQVLREHEAVESVQISISKLHIPNLSAAVDSVGVQVYRTREDVGL